MKIRTFAPMLFAAALGAFAACTNAPAPTPADETGTPADLAAAVEAGGGLMIDPPANSSKSDGRQNSNNGQCCWGHCNSSNAFENKALTSGCREWVVDTCHNAGLAFNPNGDAWWGTCI